MNKAKKFYIIVSALIVLISLITVGGGIYAYTLLAQKQSSNAENKYYLEKLSEKKDILAALSTRYEKAEPDFPLIDIALPAEKDSSKLLADLNSLASASGLKLTSMEPTTDASSTTDKNTKKKTTSDLDLLQTVKGTASYELPLIITVTGPYSKFGSFVDRVENYQRLINIETIDVTKKEIEGGTKDYVEIQLKIRAYIKK